MSLSRSSARESQAPGLIAYLLLALMFVMAIGGAALGASTNVAPNIIWGALPGALGIVGLMWIYRKPVSESPHTR